MIDPANAQERAIKDLIDEAAGTLKSRDLKWKRKVLILRGIVDELTAELEDVDGLVVDPPSDYDAPYTGFTLENVPIGSTSGPHE